MMLVFNPPITPLEIKGVVVMEKSYQALLADQIERTERNIAELQEQKRKCEEMRDVTQVNINSQKDLIKIHEVILQALKIEERT